MSSTVASHRKASAPPTALARAASSSVSRGAAGALALQLLGIALSMGVQWLLARALGAAEFGRYAYAFSLVAALHVIAKLGLDTASWRYVGQYRAVGDWPSLSGFLRASRAAAASASLAVSAAGAGSLVLFGAMLPTALAAPLAWGCVLLPLYVLNQLQVAHLVAWRRPAAGYAPALVLRPILLIAGVSAACWWATTISAGDAMALHAGAMALTLLLSEAQIRRLLPRLARSAPRIYHPRAWTRASAALWGTSCLGLASENLDVLLVGAVCGTTEAGVYAMASRLARLVQVGLMASAAASIPLAAELLASGRRRELQQVMSHAARGLAAVTLPAVLGLVVGGKWILGLLGPDFETGYPVLVILAVGQLANTLTGACGQLLNAGGFQGLVFRMNAAAAAANVLLLAALTLLWGSIGAALAGSATMVVWNLYLARQARARLGIDSTLRAAWRPT